MSVDLCKCPVLRAHAEMDRMMELGLIKGNYDPVRAVVIGRLRQRYGCHGAVRGVCPWHLALYSGGAIDARPDIPLLKGNGTGNTGQYL